MRRKRPKATTRLGEHVEGSVRLPRKKPGGRMTYALARSPLKEHGQGEAKGMALKRICRRIWEKTTSRRARGKTVERQETVEMRGGSKHVLSKDQRRAMRRLRKHGRAGAMACELADSEAAGVPIGVTLVRLGLAVVTRGNRFVLAELAGKAVPDAITWDDRPAARDGDQRARRRIGRLPSSSG
jgi:hypothetical protein